MRYGAMLREHVHQGLFVRLGVHGSFGEPRLRYRLGQQSVVRPKVWREHAGGLRGRNLDGVRRSSAGVLRTMWVSPRQAMRKGRGLRGSQRRWRAVQLGWRLQDEQLQHVRFRLPNADW